MMMMNEKKPPAQMNEAKQREAWSVFAAAHREMESEF